MGLFTEVLLGSVKEAGEAEFATLLQSFKEHNDPELYKQTIEAGDKFLQLMSQFAKKTKTKVDDYVVGMLFEPIENAIAELEN